MVENNPFVSNLEIIAVEKFHKSVGNVTISPYIIEKYSPTSLYINNDLLLALKTLSTSAKDMVFYITNYLGYDTDIIEIKPDLYCDRMEIGIKTFYRCRTELINFLIVPKKRKDTYFVNPNFLYKGNRIKTFEDKVVLENENPTMAELRRINILPPCKYPVKTNDLI